jgi:hypothetical protein
VDVRAEESVPHIARDQLRSLRAAALGVAINIFAEERDALAWLLVG